MLEVAFLIAVAALVAGNIVARISVAPLMAADNLRLGPVGN